MSVDPGNASAFLYPDDPQSWNSYAYGRNNPLLFVDPDGETYRVCQVDENGKETNCTSKENEPSDRQFREFQKNTSNDLLFKDGKIFDKASGKQIGTFQQTDVDLPGDPEANRQAAGMIVATFNTAVKEFGKNAAYAATGTVVLRGLGALGSAATNLQIFKNTKVVINWAHQLTNVRPGHIPPPGTQAEITAAVEGAIQTGNYAVKAGGLIEGTTTIMGVTVGFRGRFVDGVARIATVFTKVK
jgi:hypothetical protein